MCAKYWDEHKLNPLFFAYHAMYGCIINEWLLFFVVIIISPCKCTSTFVLLYNTFVRHKMHCTWRSSRDSVLLPRMGIRNTSSILVFCIVVVFFVHITLAGSAIQGREDDSSVTVTSSGIGWHLRNSSQAPSSPQCETSRLRPVDLHPAFLPGKRAIASRSERPLSRLDWLNSRVVEIGYCC